MKLAAECWIFILEYSAPLVQWRPEEEYEIGMVLMVCLPPPSLHLLALFLSLTEFPPTRLPKKWQLRLPFLASPCFLARPALGCVSARVAWFTNKQDQKGKILCCGELLGQWQTWRVEGVRPYSPIFSVPSLSEAIRAGADGAVGNRHLGWGWGPGSACACVRVWMCVKV